MNAKEDVVDDWRDRSATRTWSGSPRDPNRGGQLGLVRRPSFDDYLLTSWAVGRSYERTARTIVAPWTTTAFVGTCEIALLRLTQRRGASVVPSSSIPPVGARNVVEASSSG